MIGKKFNPGELVQLKSGGPKMVVEKWNGMNNAYSCSWFAGPKHNKTLFSEDALQHFQEEEK